MAIKPLHNLLSHGKSGINHRNSIYLHEMDLSRRNSKDTGIDTFLSGLSRGIIMDLNRNKHKNGSRDHEPSEFSQQSILSAMDRFVQAVNNMDDTIMVPSRLLDMPYESDGTSTGETTVVPRAVMNTDLYSFYNMLNSIKTELIWGAANGSPAGPKASASTTNGKKAQARRASTISLHSCSDSDMESESSTEFDSGLEFDEQSVRIANAFRQHLSGLFHSLHQLTESANYLTSRYQEVVGGTS
uniref:Mid1-interacting protein 1 n=1 Tax=Strigamia maritima TaxID=126957 RepID=T1J4R9_STRMM